MRFGKTNGLGKQAEKERWEQWSKAGLWVLGSGEREMEKREWMRFGTTNGSGSPGGGLQATPAQLAISRLEGE